MPTAVTVATQPASNFTRRLKLPGFTVQLLELFFGARNLYFQNLYIFFHFLSLEVQSTFFSAIACCCYGTRSFWCERQMLQLQRPLSFFQSFFATFFAIRCQLLNSAFPDRFYWVAVNLFRLPVERFFIIPFFYFFQQIDHVTVIVAITYMNV